MDLPDMIQRIEMKGIKPYAIVMHPKDTITVAEKLRMFKRHPFYSKLGVKVMKGLVLSTLPSEDEPSKVVAYFLDGTSKADLYAFSYHLRLQLGLHPTIDDVCSSGSGCVSPFTIDYSKLFAVYFSGELEQKGVYDMAVSKDMSVICTAGRVVNALRTYHDNVHWCF